MTSTLLCSHQSPLYNFISERKVSFISLQRVVIDCLRIYTHIIYISLLQLDLSGVVRDKVSGQASAEIPAPRQYYCNAG